MPHLIMFLVFSCRPGQFAEKCKQADYKAKKDGVKDTSHVVKKQHVS